MDINQQMLGVAGALRTGAYQATGPVAETLAKIANRIDPNVYAPADASTFGTADAVCAAIIDLDAILTDDRPTSVLPMRAELMEILDLIEWSRGPRTH